MRKDDRKSNRPKKEELEFDKRIINIRRVTRVYKGGKRMRLSVFLAVGDKKGRVGLGLGKGADVRTAEQKAYNAGVKNLKMVNIKGRTIPHSIEKKYKASKIMLKPAAPGTGIIAGAAARSVLELAGVKDILSKRMGTSNNISVARATMKALEELRLNRI
ncbi:MAG TPA: 30S ribosomal protein S5 [Candidatus Dojkabacteria bacterium]